jgi:hypothetical protein
VTYTRSAVGYCTLQVIFGKGETGTWVYISFACWRVPEASRLLAVVLSRDAQPRCSRTVGTRRSSQAAQAGRRLFIGSEPRGGAAFQVDGEAWGAHCSVLGLKTANRWLAEAAFVAGRRY